MSNLSSHVFHDERWKLSWDVCGILGSSGKCNGDSIIFKVNTARQYRTSGTRSEKIREWDIF